MKRFMTFLDYKHDQRLASNARIEVMMMMDFETWVNILQNVVLKKRMKQN